MQRNRRIGAWIIGCFAAFSVMPAQADVLFNFNSATSGPSLSEGASLASIQSYMNAVLLASGCSGCSVTVLGAAVDNTWNGDGHTVGTTSKSETLGNTDGATANNIAPVTNTKDNFLATTNDSGTQMTNPNSNSGVISMVFTGITVSSLSFDYEIFPDASCTSLTGSNCGGAGNPDLPTFEFTTGAISKSSNGTAVFTTNGVAPGSGDGNNKTSPTDGTNKETAPQYIGTSGSITGLSATELNFFDWPATIGIDNLDISYTTTTTTTSSSTPEPGAIVLFATMLLGVLILKNKRQKANGNATV